MQHYRSLIAFLIVLAAATFSFFHYSVWTKDSMKDGGDNWGYYAYLPAVFIHNDLGDLRHSVYARNYHHGLHADSTQPVSIGEGYRTPTGQLVLKYTCGIAILEAPAFFAAHLLTKALHGPADGYSAWYMLLVHINNLLFGFLGIWLLRRLLLKYFTDTVTAITLIAIALGTNFYHFSVYNIGMSHVYLFTLYTALILCTLRFYKAPGWLPAAGIGLLGGLITLIRPTEIICLLIPVLYGITSAGGFKQRLHSLLTNRTFYLAVLCFALCALPQLIYWKTQTGHWVYYSYGGEGFNFKHPRLFSGVFGFKNGWLPYTPVMIFALAAVPFMFFDKRNWLLPVAILLPLHIYIIYSWWCWNYINGLGSRPMVEVYPLLAIPLAMCIQFTMRYKPLAVFFGLLAGLCCAQQIFMTWQVSRNMLWSEASNKVFYFNTLFSPRLNLENIIEFDIAEKQPHDLHFNRRLAYHTYEDSLNANYIKAPGTTGNFGFALDNKIMYTPAIDIVIGSNGVQPGEWVKISFDAYNYRQSATISEYASMNADFKHGDQVYKAASLRIQNKIQPKRPYGIWVFDIDVAGKVWFFTRVPSTARPRDTLRIYGMNPSAAPVVIDNLAVEIWQ